MTLFFPPFQSTIYNDYYKNRQVTEETAFHSPRTFLESENGPKNRHLASVMNGKVSLIALVVVVISSAIAGAEEGQELYDFYKGELCVDTKNGSIEGEQPCVNQAEKSFEDMINEHIARGNQIHHMSFSYEQTVKSCVERLEHQETEKKLVIMCRSVNGPPEKVIKRALMCVSGHPTSKQLKAVTATYRKCRADRKASYC